MAPRFVLKGHAILERSGELNAHRLSLRAQISYPTIDRYINRSEALTSVDLALLAQLLTSGLGLTPQEVLAMPLSDLFDYVEEE
jgi:hypothetical protein